MLPTATTKKELYDLIIADPHKESIGMVPTMGALHSGHLSLVKRAVQDNHIVVISIFVNPTQFNNAEDLANYPKTLERDIELLRDVDHNIIVYTPSVEEIYKEDILAKEYDFKGIEEFLEGSDRPGHFNGVATIVEDLLRTVMPHKAYFGEKDFQQLAIVKSLVNQLKLPIEIIPCEIVREPNGLAMSSRNERLSPKNREEAAFIYQILSKAITLAKNKPLDEVKTYVTQLFAEQPDFQLAYFEIVKSETFTPAATFHKGVEYRFLIAVIFAGVRLLDNVSFVRE